MQVLFLHLRADFVCPMSLVHCFLYNIKHELTNKRQCMCVYVYYANVQ